MSVPTTEHMPVSPPAGRERRFGAPWQQAARSILDRARRHQLSLIGAGVAFFAMLSIAPGMVAVVSVYGLVASPADVSQQINELTATMRPPGI